MGKMKRKYLFGAALISLTPALAFARAKDSANVNLDQTVQVAGTQLAPGQYKVVWEGNGPNVTVSFAEGKKTIATVPGKLVNVSTSQQAVETIAGSDQTTVLQAIDLNKIALQFGNDAPAAGN
jgi:hypothetical protein